MSLPLTRPLPYHPTVCSLPLLSVFNLTLAGEHMMGLLTGALPHVNAGLACTSNPNYRMPLVQGYRTVLQ